MTKISRGGVTSLGDEDEYDLQYEVKFQSDNRAKIEKIKSVWEQMDDEKPEHTNS